MNTTSLAIGFYLNSVIVDLQRQRRLTTDPAEHRAWSAAIEAVRKQLRALAVKLP